MTCPGVSCIPPASPAPCAFAPPIGPKSPACNIADAEAIGFRDKVFYEMGSEKKEKLMAELDAEACRKLFEEYKGIEGKKQY